MFLCLWYDNFEAACARGQPDTGRRWREPELRAAYARMAPLLPGPASGDARTLKDRRHADAERPEMPGRRELRRRQTMKDHKKKMIAPGIGMVFALKARINEIKRGEEDDLGNY